MVDYPFDDLNNNESNTFLLIDFPVKAGSLDHLIPPARLTDSAGNGFTLVGESG